MFNKIENKQDSRIYTLSKEKPVKAVLKMSVPLIAGMFVMVLYNLVDTYFIGLTGDDYQLAAVNLAYPVMMVTVAISNIVGTGASSFIARCLGAGNEEKANHTLTTIAYTINNNLAVSYGELTVAAMGVAQKVLSLGNYVYQGFASGTQPIMGYIFGAKNKDRMRAVLKAGVTTVTCTELVLLLMYGIFAPYLIGIFSDSTEVIQTGAKVLRRLMFTLPFVGTVSMCRMAFQAMGKPIYAFCITLVRQVVLYIPLLLLMNHLFAFEGMLWAQPITESIMMCASLILILQVISKQVN